MIILDHTPLFVSPLLFCIYVSVHFVWGIFFLPRFSADKSTYGLVRITKGKEKL